MSENGKIIVGLQQNTLSKDSTLYVGALEVESSIREKYYYANGYLDIVNGNLDSYNYYATDHLGNVRHVARATPSGVGSIIQANNYYPFGGLLNEGDNQLYVQRKLYNGKEYDRMQGLNLYDYGARQYDPAICRFTSMDPLCEKYYHISPYAYCGGNPVKYVDPDGRDRYEFDRLGYVTIYEDKEKDILVVNNERVKLNSKGEELKELQLPYGTIQANISGEKDGYALLAINGDENGMKVFEFLAGATDAEWSQAKTGENSNGINYLTSSHQIDMEDGMGVFLFHNSPSISTIRELSHSHPNNHPNPSGIEPMKEDGVCVKKAGDWGDVKFAKDVLKIYPNIHQFRIFTPTTGIWHDWNKYIK